MRLALASLIALSGLASAALAQTEVPAAPAAPATAMPAPPPPAASPAAPPSATDTMPATAPEAAPAPAAPATPPAPPPPPAAPTDPAAIGVLGVLENLCMPLADGGDINKLTKAAGFRKSGDNWVLKQKTYQLTLIPPGSNPNQCHIDIVHPVDPAAPIVVALHNWAAVSNGWTLYRNDKNVDAGQEFTTRYWENDVNGKHMALVFTTIRKADGTPSRGAADTSEMLYSATKTAG
jgi:hypothetical protein